jgi:outer membrane lipoprotein-sorting protein
MSTSDSVPPPDDPIDRAIDALRRAPVPDGPPPETIARTLAALRAAAEEPGTIPRPRRRLMFTMLKMAAAVLTAAAGVSYFAGFPPRSATAEFAEVARKLQAARTLSMRQTATIAGQAAPITVRVLFKVPGLLRAEPEPAGGPVSILDMEHGKILILNPADKSATLIEEPAQGQGRGDRQRRDLASLMIDGLRQMDQKEGEPAGEKVIDGVRARGFRVKEGSQDTTVWIDSQKMLPVLIEFAGRSGGQEIHSTFGDIRLDPELDDALFRLDAPAGYALRKVNARLQMTTEEAVVRVLRDYANASGGRFPARLEDFDDFIKVVSPDTKKAQAKEAKKAIDPAAFEGALAVAEVAAFCAKMENRYGYKADGVKLGDAKAIIFWYKPEGQDKYKAVYGDLHIGEVTAEQLPR